MHVIFSSINPLAFLKKSRYLIACFVISLLTACAGHQGTAYPENFSGLTKYDKLRYIIDMQNRLDKIAGTLQINNANLCRKQVRYLLGFSAANKYSYSPVMISTATTSFGLGERLQVTNVIDGSGAKKAGLMPGDILIAVNGKALPQGANAENETVKMLSPIVAEKTAVNLTIERHGYPYVLNIPLTKACGFRVELGHSDTVNAYSDGKRILITRGMMTFAQNDHELAYVIGKEMAHNVLNHAQTLQIKEANKKIIDSLIPVNPKNVPTNQSTKPMTRQFDIDSDTLGLAMALRAGYEIDSAVGFWTRLYQTHPRSNPATYSALHPNSKARLNLMPKSITRIKAAEKRRKALSSQTDYNL